MMDSTQLRLQHLPMHLSEAFLIIPPSLFQSDWWRVLGYRQVSTNVQEIGLGTAGCLATANDDDRRTGIDSRRALTADGTQ